MATQPKWADADPVPRGCTIFFRTGETNYCPGCGQRQWLVGRLSAECAFCATAIPLNEQTTGSGIVFTRGRVDAFAPGAGR